MTSHSDEPTSSVGSGAGPLPKKAYTTIVIEREIAVPRRVAWDGLLDMLASVAGGYVSEGDPAPHGVGAVLEFGLGDLALSEEVISFEPPWRRVYELSGAPVVLYQGTTAFVDRGDSCLMSWSLLVDPLPGSASDAFVAVAEKFLTGFADRLKDMVESGS